MLGCYTIRDGRIDFIGNKIQKPLQDVKQRAFMPQTSQKLLDELATNDHYYHLHKIDDAVHRAAVGYFHSIDATWCNLPLTTKMISSPGEVYAGKKLDYTTDALPISLQWFDNESIFLAESSQFYLELRLLIDKLSRVYSIYNSFRKEPADFSHLSEFQHIEFEGKVTFEENNKIMAGMLRAITDYIIKHNEADLRYYLTPAEIEELAVAFDPKNIEVISFTDAMKLLANKLGDPKYNDVSLKHFGSYEEVALTRLIGKHCQVVEFPLEEIPFYHDASFTDKRGKQFARNADFILLGYREVVGAGQRITDIEAIRQKAKFFNLPEEDYKPYIEMRNMDTYQTTCGFGMGWQRYTQWLLKMPFIWELSHIPRGHFSPRP
jgi:aspartyl/asparaginyl-tRNA synthetase